MCIRARARRDALEDGGFRSDAQREQRNGEDKEAHDQHRVSALPKGEAHITRDDLNERSHVPESCRPS